MKTPIIELYLFQEQYLKQILDNIPNSELYNKTQFNLNSPGWILMHLIVESEDIFNHLNIQIPNNDCYWVKNFKKGIVDTSVSKEELLNLYDNRYHQLINVYNNLTNIEKSETHPSKLFQRIYNNVDSWFSHHLVNHLSIHCGNITVWKKIVKIEVNGF